VSRKNSSVSCGAGTVFRGARTRFRGARTLACRRLQALSKPLLVRCQVLAWSRPLADTRVNALVPSRICTRPRVVLLLLHQSRLHRIPLNIARDPGPLRVIPHPMVVGLALPKLLASAIQKPVGFTSRDAFQPFRQQARRDGGQQKRVDVVCHDDKRPELILAEACTTKQRFDHHCRDGFRPQVEWAGLGIPAPSASSVNITIHPRESLAVRYLAGGRKARGWQATVQVPGEEQRAPQAHQVCTP